MSEADLNVEPAVPVGRVLGTEDSTPLAFWVAVEPGQFLQLDDVVAVRREVPGRGEVNLYGVVNNVRARHEGARFDSDVFLIAKGLLPAEVCESAEILVTRCEPEIFLPPTPGQPVEKAHGEARSAALYFDQMHGQVPLGLTRDNEPVYASLEFIDGTKGAHINISGMSGVATKTSYALFLLYGLFHSGVLGQDATNSKALIFNVKGEDLLFLDKANSTIDEAQRARYQALGLTAGPFTSVAFWAPPRPGDPNAVPNVSSRSDAAVRSFFWTLADFCRDGLLEFLFADVDDERQQYTIVAQNVMAQLRRLDFDPQGAVRVAVDGVATTMRDFDQLVDFITARVESQNPQWTGSAITQGTINAFVRRLQVARQHLGHLIRADIPRAQEHRVELERRVTVVDIHTLNERAQRFVVGVMLRKTMREKEAQGRSRPLWFVVLDELNKYAPREGNSPIKDALIDIAERGRSLGMILVGAQQTASEVERRITGMSAIRVVGRLDSAEATRSEYGYLKGALQARAIILKPGTMIVSQPLVPVPLTLEFPFPAWATRLSEVAAPPPSDDEEDPFETNRGMPR
jgi:DNA helicase HerA-like ATPase